MDELDAAPDEEALYRSSKMLPLRPHRVRDVARRRRRTSTCSPGTSRPARSCWTTAAGSAPTGSPCSRPATTCTFADFDNPSTAYLRWRLRPPRPASARSYDIDRERPAGGFDLAYAFDVIEHVAGPVRVPRHDGGGRRPGARQRPGARGGRDHAAPRAAGPRSSRTTPPAQHLVALRAAPRRSHVLLYRPGAPCGLPRLRPGPC